MDTKEGEGEGEGEGVLRLKGGGVLDVRFGFIGGGACVRSTFWPDEQHYKAVQ